MTTSNNPFNTPEFLAQYWQQSPLLIRNAFSNTDLLSADDLAGLAMEPEVESRLITKNPNSDDWHLKQGPFTEKDFESLDEENWTLLVQAVDHWIPEVRSVLKDFAFLPQWRIDDIMISFAAKGGGVGPHFDQYDVFLIQLEGRREWKVGQLCDESTDLVDQMAVKILSNFEEQESWVMEPGDVLYLPPALAHWGTSLENSLTLSVGFRAPAESEVMSDFGHFLASVTSDFKRYQDMNIENRSSNSHEILATDIERLQNILKHYANQPELLSTWFGQYMTEPKYDDMGVETGNYSFEDFLNYWHNHPLTRNPSSRMAHTSGSLFVDGQRLDVKLEPAQLHFICDSDLFEFQSNKLFSMKAVQQLLWSLLNVGAVFFDD